ncbi:MAG TPA: hypothetical protein VLF62_04335, partial [Candidatus Saccharimonadales bacterium]|nr:hypothetical protein [Candidatus Saccharimonadales bacterium]
WTTHGNLITPEKTIIDITLGSWNRPEFGYKVAVGLTPQLANVTEGEWIANSVGIGHIDRRRMSRTHASLQYPHPFSILRAPGRPYRKAPPGASPYS